MTTLNTIIEEEKKEFIEKGADIEHERWSKWQAYLHSKCVEHENGKGEWVCFPSELFKRWERQINTPYSNLSEVEKESDRQEVRSYDALFTTAMQRAYEAGVQDTVGEIEKRLRQAPLFITENRVVLAIGIDDITSILKDITSNKK